MFSYGPGPFGAIFPLSDISIHSIDPLSTTSPKGRPSAPTSPITLRVSEAEVLSDVHSLVADIPSDTVIHPRIGLFESI